MNTVVQPQQPWSHQQISPCLNSFQQFQAAPFALNMSSSDSPASTPASNSWSPTDSAGGLVNNSQDNMHAEQLLLLQQLKQLQQMQQMQQHLQQQLPPQPSNGGGGGGANLQVQQMIVPSGTSSQAGPVPRVASPAQLPPMVAAAAATAAAATAAAAAAAAPQAQRSKRHAAPDIASSFKSLLASATSVYQTALREASAAATSTAAAVDAAEKAQAELAAAKEAAAKAQATLDQAASAAAAAQRMLGDISATAEAAQTTLAQASQFLSQVLKQVQLPAFNAEQLGPRQPPQQQQQQQQQYQASAAPGSYAPPASMPILYGCSSGGSNSVTPVNTPAGSSTPSALTPSDSQQTNSSAHNNNNNWVEFGTDAAGGWYQQQPQCCQVQQTAALDNDNLADWLQGLPPLSPAFNLMGGSSTQTEQIQQQQQQQQPATCFGEPIFPGGAATRGLGEPDQDQPAPKRVKQMQQAAPAGPACSGQQQLTGAGGGMDVFAMAAASLYGNRCTYMSC